MMRRHELDPVSLTFGFAFTGLGLLFLVGRADQAFRLRWIWPILLLVLGVGILADLARHRGPEEDAVPRPERDEELQHEADEGHQREDAEGLQRERDEGLERERDERLGLEGAVDNREHPV